MLSFYDNRTPFQADKLIEPFKGLWIESEGKIQNILPDGLPNHSVVILRNDSDTIECRFSSQWANQVGRYDKNDSLKFRGKISPNQNGSQLYLLDCEIVPTPRGELNGSYKSAFDAALLQDPERVKNSPLYVKLKYNFEPKAGYKSPVNQVNDGKVEFQKLYERARNGDLESYLIAQQMADWLRENARFCFASSTKFFDVLEFIETRMDDLHAIFRNERQIGGDDDPRESSKQSESGVLYYAMGVAYFQGVIAAISSQ